MKISILIPTYNRIKKLERCIQSLYRQTFKDFDIYVLCDNLDQQTYNYIDLNHPKIVPMLMTEHLYVSGCWNYFTKNYLEATKDAILWCVDDLEFYPNTLEKAVKYFEQNFPDTDGVVGINHRCPGHPKYDGKPYAFCMIGKKFIERYPDRQACSPFYTFWRQDEELYLYANSLNKFVFCKEALVNHYHPSFFGEIDETHKLSRGKIWEEDNKMFIDRQKRNKIWGINFDA